MIRAPSPTSLRDDRRDLRRGRRSGIAAFAGPRIRSPRGRRRRGAQRCRRVEGEQLRLEDSRSDRKAPRLRRGCASRPARRGLRTAVARIRSRMCRALAGSRPDVGSSSSSTGGRCIERARDRHALLQSLRELAGEVVGAIEQVDCASVSSTRAAGVGEAVQARVGQQVEADREALPKPRCFGQQSDAAARTRRGRSESSTPSIEMRPAVGRINPASIRMVVVLPAPFGPEQRDDLAGVDRQRNIANRDAIVERRASGDRQ